MLFVSADSGLERWKGKEQVITYAEEQVLNI